MTHSASPSSPLENPLWQFSLDFYRNPEVERFLLERQEHRGADVCLLLWASYSQARGYQLSEESWRVADRGLAPRRRIISSIRHMRRLLGNMYPHTRRVYVWCKRYEQKLEQRQLAVLWRLPGESRRGDQSALELAGRQYGLPQKEQARWAGLIEAYCAMAGR